MKRSSSKKKDSRSSWVEVSGERGMERAGHRMSPRVKRREDTRAPVMTDTSPVIPVLCLPKVLLEEGGRAAKRGNPNSNDHDMVDVKKSRKKKNTKLLAKQDVKRNDQMPPRIERSINDIYPAESGSLNSNIPAQPDKVSVRKRLFVSASKKKESQPLVKLDVKRNDRMHQLIEKNNNVKCPAASGSRKFDIPDQHDKVPEKRRFTSTSKKQKNQEIVMDLIKQNVLENERLRLKFQQHSKKDSE
ncbi:uncharacterized protein LOC120932283 [Rana temporaria]|uniref:uncharacterized protein LOC120932283 n=1 Tax=Rana temporaria TaxID=8407 RepID=UPI001AACA601|nr:uncharacterized protein LOC120932283 [Rana temporaria]